MSKKLICKIIGHKDQRKVSGGKLCLRCRRWQDTYDGQLKVPVSWL